MKVFVCVVLLAAVALAEPPRYRLARYRFENREVEDGQPDERKESAKAEEAPYPAAGNRPSKEFKLPSRQEVAPPSISYGVPDNSYGAPLRTYSQPEVEYGVPRMAKREEAEGEEKEGREEGNGERKEGKGREEDEGEDQGEEKKEGEAEEYEGEGKKGRKGEKSGKLEIGPDNYDEIVSTQGAYYVLLPGSQLQRVQFRTENDVSKMAYTARLQYKDEDRAPLFVYSAVPQVSQYTVPVAEYAYEYPAGASSAYFQLY